MNMPTVLTIPDMAMQVGMAFAATVAFAILFNAPARELAFCGLTGATGWFFYRLCLIFYPGEFVPASLAGAVAIAVCGRYLCYIRKTPVTVYLVAGIIPIVPGYGIYNTMYEMIITGDKMSSLNFGVLTLKIAGVIAVGLITVLSLPRGIFDFSEKN